jgi:hypothetical protein
LHRASIPYALSFVFSFSSSRLVLHLLGTQTRHVLTAPFHSQHIAAPPITVYETQANLADHEKVQGTDGGLQRASQGY